MELEADVELKTVTGARSPGDEIGKDTGRVVILHGSGDPVKRHQSA